mgnify:CR=1 FL=1
MQLPDGLTSRPLQPADARAVFEVMAAQQLADLGVVEIEEADIVADWARPSHDLGANSLGVFDGERLVGYVELTSPDRGDASVHPDYTGRGLGTALAEQMQRFGRQRGSSVVGMPVPQGSLGDRLLESLGYRVRWNSWVLELPAGTRIEPRELPAGYASAVASPDQYREVWTVIEDAFLEWSVRDREPFEDFAASVPGRPGFEPWHLRVVTDPTGSVVGVASVVMAEDYVGQTPMAYVDRLAVRRDQRRRGLAQALLVDAFAAGAEHGATRFELSTDSRTGALDLYLKVGMVVRDVWVNRAIDL